MKSTKRLFLITVEGIPGTWKSFSGGDGTSSPTKDWDGGAERPDLLSGPTEFSDIEVGRTYDPARDQQWMRDAVAKIGRGRYTVMKQPIDANYVKIGRPTTFPNCLLIGVSESEVDSASSDSAEVKFSFATSGPA